MQSMTWNMAGNTRSAARRSDGVEWLGSHSRDEMFLQEAPESVCELNGFEVVWQHATTGGAPPSWCVAEQPAGGAVL